MDDCDLAPRGWRCTGQMGHLGPCAAVPEDRGTHRRLGCAVALIVTAVLWVIIVTMVARSMDEPVKVRDNRTACERSNPPWAIAERCRR